MKGGDTILGSRKRRSSASDRGNGTGRDVIHPKEGTMKFRRNTGVLVVALVSVFFLSACGGGGGGSSSPPVPTVVTTNATGITNVSATLNGTVNPNGLATQAWFEWGTSATLATFDNTVQQAFAAGTTVQSVSATIPGLTFGTTYYFRMVASNSSGVSRGAIQNFSTAAQRPTVTTDAASNLAATTATLNGQVNPNFLPTQAWFEYGTDSNLATSTPTSSVPIGSGSAVVPTSANISGLAPGGTVYFRAAASNGAGEQKGNILSFSTANPPPVADAGVDNTVEMGQTVTLDGSGSTTPFGTITSYLWTQLNGTTVVLSDNTAIKPTFIAPAVPITGAVLRFELEIMDSRGLTATDNVDITVKWVGFSDDFSTDTTGTYTQTITAGTFGTFTWDSVGKRGRVLTGNDNALSVSHSVLATNTGIFSMDFTPTTPYPSHAGIWVRLVQDANNYYEISNFDWASFGGTPSGNDIAQIIKVVGGVVTDNVFLPQTAYSQNTTYNLGITFSPTQVILQGFGSTVTLNTGNTTPISVSSMEVELGQQDAFLDNFKLLASP